MATVYNEKGETVEIDYVDAVEYVETGRYFWVMPEIIEKPVK